MLSELTQSVFNCSESNDLLKYKFKKLHTTVVNNVNPSSIINFLFQEDVLGADDMRALLKFRDDPQQQCSELLALLHTSGNQQAFVQLYEAIKKESHLKWLVEDIDKFTDQSLQQQQQQQRYISEPTGKHAVFQLHLEILSLYSTVMSASSRSSVIVKRVTGEPSVFARSRANNSLPGTFAPGNERFRELSLP